MKDKRSILKASGVDDLFAKMEEACHARLLWREWL